MAAAGVVAVSPGLVFAAPTSSQSVDEPRVDAYDRATGRLRWSFPFAPEPVAAPIIGQTVVASSSVITVLAHGGFSGGTTFPDGTRKPFAPTTLVAVDTHTGIERSRVVVADPDFTSKDAPSDGVVALIDGTDIVGLDLASGVKWRHPIPSSETPEWRKLARTELTAIALFVAAQPPGRIKANVQAQALVVATGQRRWKHTIRFTYAFPTAVAANAHVAFSVACGTA